MLNYEDVQSFSRLRKNAFLIVLKIAKRSSFYDSSIFA